MIWVVVVVLLVFVLVIGVAWKMCFDYSFQANSAIWQAATLVGACDAALLSHTGKLVSGASLKVRQSKVVTNCNLECGPLSTVRINSA